MYFIFFACLGNYNNGFSGCDLYEDEVCENKWLTQKYTSKSCMIRQLFVPLHHETENSDIRRLFRGIYGDLEREGTGESAIRTSVAEIARPIAQEIRETRSRRHLRTENGIRWQHLPRVLHLRRGQHCGSLQWLSEKDAEDTAE